MKKHFCDLCGDEIHVDNKYEVVVARDNVVVAKIEDVCSPCVVSFDPKIAGGVASDARLRREGLI